MAFMGVKTLKHLQAKPQALAGAKQNRPQQALAALRPDSADGNT